MTFKRLDNASNYQSGGSGESLLTRIGVTVLQVGGVIAVLMAAMYLYIMYVVYNVVSTSTENLSLYSAWWFIPPPISGILGMVTVTILAFWIFTGFFKSDKTKMFVTLCGLSLLSAGGQYYVRDTKLMDNYLCSGAGIQTPYVSNKPISAFNKKPCMEIGESMLASAKAFADGKVARKLTLISVQGIQDLTISSMGVTKLFVSNKTLSNGDYVFYDGAGVSETHTEDNPDFLIPATDMHKAQNIRTLKGIKVSELNSKLADINRKIATIEKDRATVPPVIGPFKIDRANPRMEIPNYYTTKSGSNINLNADGTHVVLECGAPNIVISIIVKSFFCDGHVYFYMSNEKVDRMVAKLKEELIPFESEIRALGQMPSPSSAYSSPSSNKTASSYSPEKGKLAEIQAERERNMAIVNAAPIQNTEDELMIFKFHNRYPQALSFEFKRGVTETNRVKEGPISIGSNCSGKKMTGATISFNDGPARGICSIVPDVELQVGDTYTIVNRSDTDIVTMNINH